MVNDEQLSKPATLAFPVPVPSVSELNQAISQTHQSFTPRLSDEARGHLPSDIAGWMDFFPNDPRAVATGVAAWDASRSIFAAYGIDLVPEEEKRAVEELREEIVRHQLDTARTTEQARRQLPAVLSLVASIQRINQGPRPNDHTLRALYSGPYTQVQAYMRKYGLLDTLERPVAEAAFIEEPIKPGVVARVTAIVRSVINPIQTPPPAELVTRPDRLAALEAIALDRASKADEHSFVNATTLRELYKPYATEYQHALSITDSGEKDKAQKRLFKKITKDLDEVLRRIQKSGKFTVEQQTIDLDKSPWYVEAYKPPKKSQKLITIYRITPKQVSTNSFPLIAGTFPIGDWSPEQSLIPGDVLIGDQETSISPTAAEEMTLQPEDPFELILNQINETLRPDGLNPNETSVLKMFISGSAEYPVTAERVVLELMADSLDDILLHLDGGEISQEEGKRQYEELLQNAYAILDTFETKMTKAGKIALHSIKNIDFQKHIWQLCQYGYSENEFQNLALRLLSESWRESEHRGYTLSTYQDLFEDQQASESTIEIYEREGTYPIYVDRQRMLNAATIDSDDKKRQLDAILVGLKTGQVATVVLNDTDNELWVANKGSHMRLVLYRTTIDGRKVLLAVDSFWVVESTRAYNQAVYTRWRNQGESLAQAISKSKQKE